MKEALSRKHHIDSSALWSDLMTIAEFTEPDMPYTRRSFSDLHREGRNWLRLKLVEAGLTVRVDCAGNLIGRLAASDNSATTIMLGSHSDTVPGGGRFDGVAGVIAAIEIARSLKKRGAKLRHHLEVVDFLAEEPNPYGLSCVGSRGMAGQLDERMLAYSEPGGETLAEAITRAGGNAQKIEQAERGDISAFFELHIEQGPVLENEKIDLGLVTAIVGITRLELVFRGEADHAGTTPMHLRRDAAACAAEVMVATRRLAEKMAAAGKGYFVATTGVVEVSPGAMNVVPETTRIVIDARSEKQELMESFCQEVDRVAVSVASALRVDFTEATRLSCTSPAACDQKLRSLLRSSADDLGLSTRDLASGAGHDAAFISRIAPAAMVFVPCLKGKSHAPEEWAEQEALAAGAAVIAEAVVRLDAKIE